MRVNKLKTAVRSMPFCSGPPDFFMYMYIYTCWLVEYKHFCEACNEEVHEHVVCTKVMVVISFLQGKKSHIVPRLHDNGNKKLTFTSRPEKKTSLSFQLWDKHVVAECISARLIYSHDVCMYMYVGVCHDRNVN